MQIYEHLHTEFVAGFVGVSNAFDRDGSRISVRPEKIRLLDEGEQAATPAPTSSRVDQRGLRGYATRYLVDLEGGGQLTVVRQNL